MINTSWIDLKILPQKLKERGQISQKVFIEFGHWMQKLQHLDLDVLPDYVRTLLVPFGDEAILLYWRDSECQNSDIHKQKTLKTSKHLEYQIHACLEKSHCRECPPEISIL